MKRLILLLSFLVLLPQMAFGQDALSLRPSASFIQVGEGLELAVDASFASAVLGGEVRVDYDHSVLHLAAIDWNLAYGDDPLLRCPPGASAIGARGCEGDGAFMAMGSLGGLPDGLVANLVFVGSAEGVTTVMFEPVSPFSDLMGGAVATSHGTAEVTVVPEPGLAMAIGSGCLLLATAGRRRSARRGGSGRRQGD